jgi:hypothetical protein
MDERDMFRAETAHEDVQVQYVGSLKEFGLGSKDGIPARVVEPEEIHKTCEDLHEHLREYTDRHQLSCIDGRTTLQNSDGSSRMVRPRVAGGTGSLLEVLLNADAPIAWHKTPDNSEVFGPDGTIGDEMNLLHKQLAERLGVLPSCHNGTCGAVCGAIADNKSIAENPAIMDGVQALMDIFQVRSFTGIEFDATYAAQIKSNAAITAEYLEQADWSGEKFVEGASKDNPRGCEELLTATDRYHGHREKGIVLVLDRERTTDLDDYFIADIQPLLDIANAFSGVGGEQKRQEIFIALLAKLVATASRLNDPDAPLYIVS